MAGCLGAVETGDSDGGRSDEDDSDERDDSEGVDGEIGDDADEADEDGEQDGQDTDSEDDEDVEIPDNGAITFIYDDGPIEDLEQAFPAHQQYDAPASAGIVPSWMNGDRPEFMDIEDVRTLADAGWEISCHTMDHAAISSFELVEDVLPGATRIYPEGRGQHGFSTGNPIEITDGDETVERTVVDSGTDDTGQYLDVDEPIDEAFTAGETVERYTESYVRSQLGDSLGALDEFDPTTFLAPHDVIDAYHLDIVDDYYDGVFNVNLETPSNDIPFDPFDTNRSYFAERVDRENVYEDLEAVAETNGYGVIGAHTYLDEVTQKRIEETLAWCDELGLEVITFDDAIERFGLQDQ